MPRGNRKFRMWDTTKKKKKSMSLGREEEGTASDQRDLTQPLIMQN